MNIVRTAVQVTREKTLLAETDISNGDETGVLNVCNLVPMSNVCSFGKPKRNAGEDKELRRKNQKQKRAENNTPSNVSPIYWQRSQRWSNTIFRLPLRSKA